MKKNEPLQAPRRQGFTKVLLLMKLTIVLILVATLQVSAKLDAQNMITLNLKNSGLKAALQQIERKSSYRFLYNDEVISSNQKVDINVSNAPVTQVLDKILAVTELSYRLLNNNLVVITPKNAVVNDTRVTGKVTNSAGEAIPAVSVKIKGSAAGTSTASDGTYALSVPDGATLVFSSVGYEDIEVAVNGRTSIDVVMTSSVRLIDQVVVVGYGTQRKRDLTGSIASVKGAEIAKQPVQTATQAIQGKVAGVQIISSGEPNSLPTVRVRGVGTMLGGASPLYVVDGVFTDDIRNINSNDIVTLDILKDASSTAIYGMRAANGVIIITTKKGRTGKTVFNYDANIGLREATNLVNMAGERQYAGYLNEASIYYGSGDSLVTSSMLKGYNTDWYEAILQRGFQQNHNLSMSGGSEKITYFLGANYLTDEGIQVNNRFKRFTLRSNNEYRLSKKLKLITLLSYSNSQAEGALFDAFNNAYRAAPTVLPKAGNKYGNTSAAGNVGNPLLSIDKRDNLVKGNRLQGSFALEFKPISALTLRSAMNIDLDYTKSRTYEYRFLSDSNTFVAAGGNQQRGNSKLSLDKNDATRWIWDNTATYSKIFGSHNLTVLAGMTAEEYNYNGVASSALDVPANEDQWYLNAGSAGSQIVSNTGDKYTRVSYLGRLNYAFNNRYLLTASIRRDGTSKFGTNSRWDNFPSVGLGWNISQEGFMANQKIFSNLKLRASWGLVGNENIPSSLFRSLATINLPYYFDGTRYLGIRFENINDANLRWEKTEELDFGLDFSVLSGRLTGEIDYYSKKSKDALIFVQVDRVFGDDQYVTNAASYQNRGVELGLTWSDKIGKDWTYSIGGNISYNKNKVINLNGGQALFEGSVNGNFTTKSDNGQPIGSFYLLQFDGIFQNEAQIAASAQTTARPGDIRYKDISGPAGTPDGIINDFDRTYSGSYIPKFTYGVNGNVSYKSFDLSFGGYGTSGSKIYNGKKATRGTDFRDNIETDVANGRWTPNNPSNSIPRATTAILPASTYFLENGNFFRLNNLTVGYTFGRNRVMSMAKISSLRMYVTAQNLFTLTPYSGYTPEITSSGPLNAGIESNTYPTTRTFAFGVNLAF